MLKSPWAIKFKQFSSETQTLTQQYTKMLQFKTVLKHVTVLKLYHDKQLKHCEHSFKADVKRQTWQTIDCLELWQYTTYKLTNRCQLPAPVNPASLQM